MIGTGIWFIVEPPSTRQWFPDQNRKADVILKCNVKDARILQSLVYNMLLITLSTIYAIKTRKIPENFNESKFIGFTMYTTCIIWLAFIPLFFGTGNNYEVRKFQTTLYSLSLQYKSNTLFLYIKLFFVLFFFLFIRWLTHPTDVHVQSSIVYNLL